MEVLRVRCPLSAGGGGAAASAGRSGARKPEINDVKFDKVCQALLISIVCFVVGCCVDVGGGVGASIGNRYFWGVGLVGIFAAAIAWQPHVLSSV